MVFTSWAVPTMGGSLLHETAVAWLRWLMGWSIPKEPWLETPAEFNSRMQEARRKVNKDYEVENLSRELPKRR